MFLDKLSVINFKNLEHTALEFTSRLNCLVGENGAGKTNVLDAVHYLSVCRSALPVSDNQCVRHGNDFFMLEGEYRTGDDRRENVVCSFKKGTGKTLRRNGKPYGKLSEHVGFIPVVTVSPADSMLITDSAEERRRFLNSFLCQLDRDYLAATVKYNHVMTERNRLLKQMPSSGELLDVLDMQLCGYGKKVHREREKLSNRLSPLVTEYYRMLSGGRETVEMEYRSELNEQDYAGLLASARQKDMISQFTTCGVHRDELKMKIDGYPLRRFGSQGQQKSFLLALKLAQYTIICDDTAKKPVLLLDDVFDKLDQNRVGELLKLVSGKEFGQIFITDCSRSRLDKILGEFGEPYTIFVVENGKVDQK